jgi:Na+/melibiose symporter-like transporter
MKRLCSNKPAAVRNTRLKRLVAGLMTFAIMVCSFAVTVFADDAVKIKTNITTEGLVGGIVGFVIKAAFYIGIVVLATGIFMFVFAYKDDNAESQSRGARFAVVGALLVGLRVLLQLVGIIE